MPGGEGRRRQNGPAVKIQDVASLAGVSPMSVSRALNSPDQVSPETLKKVMHAVKQTGYVPNLAASSLRSAKTKLVVVLVPSLAIHYSEMITSLTDALVAKGFQVMLGQIGYETAQETEVVRAILGRRPDGIVMMGVVQSADSRRLLLDAAIPIVETFDMTPTPIDMLVGFSHEDMSFEVCKYLAERGRKHLALMSGSDQRAVRRKNAYLKAAKSMGLRPPATHLSGTPPTHGRGRLALRELLTEYPDIDAVWCSSDMLAMGAITEAQARGIPVPGTLAVVGAGDLDFAATMTPTLTSVRTDGRQLGVTAARAIIDRVEGRHVTDKIVDIGFSVICRESA